MASLDIHQDAFSSNPLDIVEHLVESNDWAFSRKSGFSPGLNVLDGPGQADSLAYSFSLSLISSRPLSTINRARAESALAPESPIGHATICSP